jgi:hypothetical protein
MSEPQSVSLTLFVCSGQESDAAREELQVLVVHMATDPDLRICGPDDPEAAALGVTSAPTLRVQIGEASPAWVKGFERRSLRRRLLDLGVAFRD